MEVLVTTGIFLLVMALGGQFITGGFDILRFQADQEEAVANARVAMNSLSRDLREARSSERGDYPLSAAEEQNLVWYGDIDNDEEAERIRYYQEASELKRVVTEPGPADDYNGDAATTTIAKYLNNETDPIFRYFDSANNETGAINEVRLIGVYLKVNVTPNQRPNDYQLESFVHLRNLKENL